MSTAVHLISKLFGRKVKESSVKFHRPSQLCKNRAVIFVSVRHKTKNMVMARDQNAGRSHNMKIDNSSIERMEEFKYLGTKTKLNSVALVRERTIPTEWPPPVGEASANFCG
jgi:hypothetical protein